MSKNYRKLTEQIISLVGGKENIKSVTNCATRLRFYLEDEEKAKTEELKKTDGIAGVVKNGGQYQVIIGPDVDLVMEEIRKIGGIKVEGGAGAIREEKEKLTWKNAFGKFLGTVSTIFIPIIPCLAGAGILQAILILLKTAGIVPEDNQTYVMLNMVSGAVFYYLPVMLAFSSAKVFKCNQYMAAVMSFMLLHPTFMGFVEAGDSIRMFGIPVTLVKYSSSVLPAIFITLFMSVVERISKKFVPKAIKFITVPVITFVITSVVGFTVLGPIGTWCGNLLVVLFNWLDANIPWFCPVIMGTFSPLIVMTGMHNGLKAITYSQYALRGYATATGPGNLCSNVAQGAAAFVVCLKSKKSGKKQMAFSAAISALIGGITEPALYGITLKYKSVLWSVMLGGGVAGLWAGFSRMRTYSPGPASVLGLPCYVGGDSLQNMINAAIAIVISAAVTMVAMLVFGMKDVRKAEENEEETDTELDDLMEI